MSQFTRVVKTLESEKPGFFIKNEDNGREVEVTCMVGGRYLCVDSNGDSVKQTHSASVAYHFLVGNADLKYQHR